jgi:hypothetical protein
MSEPVVDEALRRRNVRTAWLLAAFAIFMLVSSVPFWRGMVRMLTSASGG